MWSEQTGVSYMSHRNNEEPIAMTNSLKGKKLLLLGGDTFSVDIVKTARSMGIYTIVTDWYDTRRSPAKLVADEYWNISTEAYDELLTKMREEKVDGVFTGFTDSYLPVYQHLCELGGYPCYGTKEQFECFTNKSQYKALCLQFNVPTIEAYTEDSDDIRFPVLVKPVDGSGSRGISICKDRTEMLTAIEKGKQFSKQQKVLIERYMDGREVTVFWLFVDGTAYLTGIGNRHVQPCGEGLIPLPVGYTFPSVHTIKYQQEVEQNAKAMFRHAGIKNGMMFMQCKVEDGTCYVYDIGFRLTGSLEYKILEHIYGVNPLKMMLRYALTGKMSDDEKPLDINPVYPYPAFNVSCLCAPGTIERIEGTDELESEQHILGTNIAHLPGDTITEQMRGLLAQITVRVLGYADSRDQLLPMMNHIEQTIIVRDTNGRNIRLSNHIGSKDIEGQLII